MLVQGLFCFLVHLTIADPRVIPVSMLSLSFTAIKIEGAYVLKRFKS